jgi:hypothetical protein
MRNIPPADSPGKPASPRRPKSWRDVLPVHPAADLFPPMSEAELRELGEDIKAHGLVAPIILWSTDPKAYDLYCRKGKISKSVFVLDGRNRLDAMEAVGMQIFGESGRFDLPSGLSLPIEWLIGDEPDLYAVAISANIQRRHLTAEQKRDLIVKVLRAKPEQSNVKIAEQVKADDKTVAKVRRELESTSEIPKLEKTVGKDGKARKQPKKRDVEKERRAREERKLAARGDLPSLEEILAEPPDDEATIQELTTAIRATLDKAADCTAEAVLAIIDMMDERERQRFHEAYQRKFGKIVDRHQADDDYSLPADGSFPRFLDRREGRP